MQDPLLHSNRPPTQLNLLAFMPQYYTNKPLRTDTSNPAQPILLSFTLLLFSFSLLPPLSPHHPTRVPDSFQNYIPLSRISRSCAFTHLASSSIFHASVTNKPLRRITRI